MFYHAFKMNSKWITVVPKMLSSQIIFCFAHKSYQMWVFQRKYCGTVTRSLLGWRASTFMYIRTSWLNALVQSIQIPFHSLLLGVTWGHMGEGGHMISLGIHRLHDLSGTHTVRTILFIHRLLCITCCGTPPYYLHTDSNWTDLASFNFPFKYHIILHNSSSSCWL